MSKSDQQSVWLFDFALESQSGQPVSSELSEQLLDHIVEWAEAHGLQIGGGYRPPRAEEVACGPSVESDERNRRDGGAREASEPSEARVRHVS